MITNVIEAPDDAFVHSVAADGQVTAGQTLVTLSSPVLDRQKSSLKALHDHIEILERPFNDGRIGDEINIIKQKVNALKDDCDFLKELVHVTENKYKAGRGEVDDVLKAKVSQNQAISAYLDAQLSASHADRKKLDLLDKVQLAKAKLAKEQVFVDAMYAGMTIVAPVAGKFKARVSVGAFLKKDML